MRSMVELNFVMLFLTNYFTTIKKISDWLFRAFDEKILFVILFGLYIIFDMLDDGSKIFCTSFF